MTELNTSLLKQMAELRKMRIADCVPMNPAMEKTEYSQQRNGPALKKKRTDTMPLEIKAVELMVDFKAHYDKGEIREAIKYFLPLKKLLLGG